MSRDLMEVHPDHRCMHKLVEVVDKEIEKYKELKKERKDKKSIVNDKVKSIQALINQYETINFQEELFKIVKYE